MIYSNPEFLCLFSLTLAGYLLFDRYEQRFRLLLAASILFYAWAGLFDALIFVFVVSVSWSAVALAHRHARYKKPLIAAGISIMVAHLFLWKYAAWAVSQVQLVFPAFFGGRTLHLPLPVGISFFTLQGIAYLADYSHNDAKYMKLPMYLLFKSFFAQLVAGPIVRAHQVLPQLEKLPKPALADLSVGLSFFVLGFVKKLLIADRISPFVDAVFDTPQHFGRWVLVKALLGYTVQIWADFSGYTDMGRGAARMLGIRLPENFLSPYLALSPSEFWRRWHVTLSEWIRDYIYIPLGGSRGSVTRVAGVVVLTMSISGLWHGARWHFLVWGLYHGVLLALERKLNVGSLKLGRVGKALQGLAMLSSIVFGWLLFRAGSFSCVASFLKGICWNTGLLPSPPHGINVAMGIAFCAVAQSALYTDLRTGEQPLVSWVRRLDVSGSPALAGACAGGALAAVFVVSLLLRQAGQSFIYFQF